MNPYEVLGVSQEATLEEIKKKFRELSKKHHPDIVGGDEEIFIEINIAYKVLSNEEKRKHFDEFGFVDEINDSLIEKVANSKLVELCENWLNGVIKCATTQNKIKPLSLYFREQVREVKSQIKQKELDLKMIKKDLKRVSKRVSHKKDSQTVLHNLIQQKLKEIKIQQYQIKCDSSMINKLEEMLNEYEYEADSEDEMITMVHGGLNVNFFNFDV